MCGRGGDGGEGNPKRSWLIVAFVGLCCLGSYLHGVLHIRFRAIATVLVQRGVLKKGSVMVAGPCYGKVS
jgi:hypothetical protein